MLDSADSVFVLLLKVLRKRRIYNRFYGQPRLQPLAKGMDNIPAGKSQGMKQLMAGGGIIVLGTTLIPLLSTLF